MAPRPPNWRQPLRDAALSEAFLTCFNDYVVSSFTAGETVNLVLLASVLLLAMASPPRVETRGNDRGDNQRHGPCSRSPAKPSRCTRTPRAPAP